MTFFCFIVFFLSTAGDRSEGRGGGAGGEEETGVEIPASKATVLRGHESEVISNSHRLLATYRSFATEPFPLPIGVGSLFFSFPS